MAQARAVTPFMAVLRGVDHRILRDVGVNADGNPVDGSDPRVRRLVRRGFVEQLAVLLSAAGWVLRSRRAPTTAPTA